MDPSEQREILYRLDERTEHIQKNVESLKKRSLKNEKQIKKTKKRSEKNETKITAAMYVLGASLTAIIAEMAGLIPL